LLSGNFGVLHLRAFVIELMTLGHILALSQARVYFGVLTSDIRDELSAALGTEVVR
jgi:hypothetical protein